MRSGTMGGLPGNWHHLPAITSVIIGGRRPEQVLRNIKALDLRLDDSLIAELNAATETVKQALGTNNDMFCGGANGRTR